MTTESQRVLVLNSTDVKLLLPMRECIDVMASALVDLTRGEFLQRSVSSTAMPLSTKMLIKVVCCYRGVKQVSCWQS